VLLVGSEVLHVERRGAIFFGDFADKLSRSDDVETRWCTFVDLLNSCGADQVNYALMSAEHRAGDQVLFRSTMCADWLSYYGEKRFDQHDPHVKILKSGHFTPYIWSEDNTDAVTDASEREVCREGNAAGMRGQIHLVLPDTLSGRRPIGGMALGSSLAPREFFKAISGLEMALMTAGMLFHQYSYHHLRRKELGTNPLSAREAECLSLIAAGYRVDRIADRLVLASQTVELHLRNARAKLKSRTTPQAVARALLTGEIVL
jgi:DNA-binding CsgD family transcriptional regulator